MSLSAYGVPPRSALVGSRLDVPQPRGGYLRADDGCRAKSGETADGDGGVLTEGKR